jgi:hypothetical protein
MFIEAKLGPEVCVFFAASRWQSKTWQQAQKQVKNGGTSRFAGILR